MKKILFITFILLMGLVSAADFTPQGNINLRDYYNITGAPYINATIYYGNGSALTGITSSTSNSTTNSTTWWASVSGWVSGWFIQTGNDLDFNETKLNETIEAIDTATNTSMKTYVDGVNTSQTSWTDSLFVRFTELVSQIGNWTADKTDYYTHPTIDGFNLSHWTDDLGNRGYTSNLNFTNDAGYYNSADFSIGDYSTTAEIIAFGYYNSSDFVITDYFTKTEITDFSYYNSTDFDISNYFTSAEVLAFDYYNSTDFDINDYVTSTTLSGYSYYNSTDFDISDYYLNTNPFTFINNSALIDNSMADTLHRHSELSASDGTPDRALVVDAIGRVGIGTTAPVGKLNVLGDGNFTGTIYSNGNAVLTSESDPKAYNGTLAYLSDILNWDYYNSTDFVITDYSTTSEADALYRAESWDNFTGIPTATPSDGDTTHLSTANQIRDYVIGLAYATTTYVDNLVGTYTHLSNYTDDLGDRGYTSNSNFTNDEGYTTNTGTVTSIATTAPISGGTITSTGTISLDTAMPSDGDTTHASTADQIYDFVIGLGYATTSWVTTQLLSYTTTANLWAIIYNETEVDTLLAAQDACSEITGCVESAITSLAGDTSPQLGGYLDTAGQNIGSTADEIENVYVATNSRIYFGDGQEASIYLNSSGVLIIG